MNDIHDEIIKAQAEQALHIANMTGQNDLIEKAFNDVIEKGGKRGTLGEIREWSGKKYRKTSNGWELVKEQIKTSKIEEEHIKDEDRRLPGKEEPEKVETPIKESAPKTVRAKESLDYTKYDYSYTKKELGEIYVKSHRSYQVLDETYNTFKEKANKLIKADKGKHTFSFNFEAGWYDHHHKASIGGYVSIDRDELYEEFKTEFEEQKKKYTYGFNRDGFMAEKIKQICSSYGVKAYGGSSSYSSHGSQIFLPLETGEID